MWLLWCSSVRLEGGPDGDGLSAFPPSITGPSLFDKAACVPPDVKLSALAPIPKVVTDVQPTIVEGAPVTAAYRTLSSLSRNPLSILHIIGTLSTFAASLSNTGSSRGGGFGVGSSKHLLSRSPQSTRPVGGGALGSVSHHSATYAFLADDRVEAPLVDADTVRV